MKAKLIFNSIIFSLAGIISLIRLDGTAVLVSFSFSALFVALHIILKKDNETGMLEQFD